MGGTFLSIDGHALALGMFFDENVVSQVKRLQCKACGEQPQQGDVSESGAHGTLGCEAGDGQYTARSRRASARNSSGPGADSRDSGATDASGDGFVGPRQWMIGGGDPVSFAGSGSACTA